MSPLALPAQVDICSDQSYEIMNVLPATAGGVEVMYRWLENGQVVAGASADSYTVLAGKAEGVYTYVCEAKTEACDAWQPSNEFVVTVFACTFTLGQATTISVALTASPCVA